MQLLLPSPPLVPLPDFLQTLLKLLPWLPLPAPPPGAPPWPSWLPPSPRLRRAGRRSRLLSQFPPPLKLRRTSPTCPSFVSHLRQDPHGQTSSMQCPKAARPHQSSTSPAQRSVLSCGATDPPSRASPQPCCGRAFAYAARPPHGKTAGASDPRASYESVTCVSSVERHRAFVKRYTFNTIPSSGSTVPGNVSRASVSSFCAGTRSSIALTWNSASCFTPAAFANSAACRAVVCPVCFASSTSLCKKFASQMRRSASFASGSISSVTVMSVI